MFFQLITIDFSQVLAFGDANPFLVMWRIFVIGGWIPLVVVCLWGFKKAWINWRQDLFAAKAKYVLLAIDVPKENEQLPKAVENVFNHIHGAGVNVDFFEKWWKGKLQPNFSFEICSHGGYVQFYVRCETRFRDLVESAIFSQYPDAEINEVEDYAKPFAVIKIPPPEETSLDIFGTEFRLKKPNYLPIRTYPEFEEKLAGEFKDPLGTLLESLSKIRPEEQIWLQILCCPTGSEWQKDSIKFIKKTAGIKESAKPSAAGSILGAPFNFLGEALVHGGVFGPPPEKKKDDTSMFKMLMMTPDTKSIMDAVATKAGKAGFDTKIRFVYISPKNVKFVPRVYATIKGSLNQFNALHLNGFTPFLRVMTQDDYFWLRWTLDGKKRRLLSRYISRSGDGAPRSVLNVEELATIYHFPIITTKAPLVKKTESRRAEPPAGLPVSARPIGSPTEGAWSKPSKPPKLAAPAKPGSATSGAAPPSLPTV